MSVALARGVHEIELDDMPLHAAIEPTLDGERPQPVENTPPYNTNPPGPDTQSEQTPQPVENQLTCNTNPPGLP
jgi:hypothetical protein